MTGDDLKAHGMLTEWASLMDLHKAPGAREDELYRQWICHPGPADSKALLEGHRGILRDLLPGGEFRENQWGAAAGCAAAARQLLLGGKPYLEAAALRAEHVCGMINDPATGVIFTQHGPTYRPSVFFKKSTPDKNANRMRAWGVENPESFADEDVYYTNWLMTGNSLRGVLRTIEWILAHPEVHDLSAPQIPGYSRSTGRTYKEKAVHWLMQAKGAYDHFERYQPFNEEEGMWIVNVYDERRKTVVQRSLPVNRFFNFTASYLKTGAVLNQYDSTTYASWYAQAKKRTRQAVRYFRDSWNLSIWEGKYPTANRFGRLGVWGYGRNSSSEDFMHLGMDVEPMTQIYTIYPEAYEGDDLKVIANTLFSGSYNYVSHSKFQGLFRGVHPPAADGQYKEGPRFGELTAPHLSDEMYEIMVREHKLILDRWLEQKYYINRIFTRFNVPIELYLARKARYGRTQKSSEQILAEIPDGVCKLPKERQANLEWFHKAGRGMIIHYLYRYKVRSDEISWSDCVDRFDTDLFAGNVNKMGLKYVILTMQQGNRYFPAPNATWDRIGGYKPGEVSATRDLVLDLYESLNKHDIKLMLYWTGDGPIRDKEALRAVRVGAEAKDLSGFIGTGAFFENWLNVLREYSLRYGDKVAGWWLDGTYSRLGYEEKSWKAIIDTCRAGNPRAIVAINNPVRPGKHRAAYASTLDADYTAGEIAPGKLGTRPTARWKGGIQWHILAPMGGWGAPGLPWKDPARMADYTRSIMDKGGCLTLDLCVDRFGIMNQEQLDYMIRVNELLK
jgi:hypothetical protein